ncbi:histidine kinase dimerization/phosphoacceptor domain -containing protein, partial [Nitrospirota bacterium]
MLKSTINKVLKHIQRYRISYRIVLYTICASLALSVLISGYGIKLEYQKDLKDVQDSLNQVEESFIDQIAMNIWETNELQLDKILRSILIVSDIQFAEIVELRGDSEVVTASKGTRVKGEAINHEFPIVYGKDNGMLIGKLYVTVNLDKINKRMHERFIMALITQSLIIFLASFVVIVIIQQLLLRHINTMADYMRSFDMNDLDTPLSLSRRSNIKLEPDALEQVQRAVNLMLQKLRDYVAENRTVTRQIEKTLDEKEVLLKEIHHRVKNNMNVIISLLGLQSRLLKDEKSKEAFQESTQRIKAM